jgi:hypothetical protein
VQLPTSVPVDGEETPLPPADDTAAAEAVLAALYEDGDLLDDWDDPDLREVGIRPPAPRLRLDRVARRLVLPDGSAR